MKQDIDHLNDSVVAAALEDQEKCRPTTLKDEKIIETFRPLMNLKRTKRSDAALSNEDIKEMSENTGMKKLNKLKRTTVVWGC